MGDLCRFIIELLYLESEYFFSINPHVNITIQAIVGLTRNR